MTESQFGVYLSNPVVELQFFACIVTAFSQQETLKTEWFYVFHDTKTSWKARGFYITMPSSIEIASSAEKAWQSETLPHLKSTIISEQILPLLEKLNFPLTASFSFDLHKCDNSTLFAVNRIFEGFLRQTKDRTGCKSLRDYIDLVHSVKIDSAPIPF